MMHREKSKYKYLSTLIAIALLAPQKLCSDTKPAQEHAATAQSGMLLLLKQGSLQKHVTPVDRKLWIELLDQWVTALEELGINEEPQQIRSTVTGLINKQDPEPLKQTIKLLAGKDNTQGSIRNHIQKIKLEAHNATADKDSPPIQHSDVFQQRTEVITALNGSGTRSVSSWAARLDFLSTLNAVDFGANGNAVPLVIYSNPNGSGHISIGGNDISPLSAPRNGFTPIPAVQVIESIDGSVPNSVRWADYPENGSTKINADGTGLANLQRGFFSSQNNYTPLSTNVAQQSQLWIVPSLNADGTMSATTNSIFTLIYSAKQGTKSFKRSQRTIKKSPDNSSNQVKLLNDYVLPLVDALAKL